MKILFFGSGAFAVRPLEAILKAGHKVSLVITQPDRRKGRHLFLRPTPVKEFAISNDLELFQPQDINNPESFDMLTKQQADVYVVVSYGSILNADILNSAKSLCLNIHASLLPKYRGASPINRALMNGEKYTGVTFIKMNKKMDAGDIITSDKINIADDDNFLTLHDKLSELSFRMLPLVLDSVSSGNISLRAQNEKEATYAPAMKKIEGLINWNSDPKMLYNHFRGCYGWPGSFTYFRSNMLKITDLNPVESKYTGRPGEIVSVNEDSIEVSCLNGCIRVKEVLPASHKKISAKDFIAGYQPKIGEQLG